MSHSRFPKKVIVEAGPQGPLTEIEQATFEDLKSEYIAIEKTSWKRKAEILATMKENRLYRESHSTFEEFCSSVFDLTRQRAHQLVCSVKTIAIAESEINDVNHGLQTQPKLTLNERHARELQKLPSNQMRKAAAKLKGKEKITHRDVVEAVKSTKKEAEVQKAATISGHVQTAMKTAEDIAKHVRAIKTGCTALQLVFESPFGIHMPKGQPLDQIKRTADLIMAGAPYADCVYCGSKGKECRACNGHGWVTKGQFNATPYDLRAKSKVHAKED